ncbi:MAG TPA: ABC transporter substrate-binding protein [Candidatus Tectomicrobia bacterium]
MWYRLIEVVILALSLIVPGAAEAQPVAKVPQIGLLSFLRPSVNSRFWEAFRDSLREMGYVEDQNVAFVERYAERQADRLPALADELVRHSVDVIVVSETPAIHAAIQATTTIPIVMLTVGDPVESGFAQSLARPGGNVTGVGGLVNDLNRKWLELLKEAVPGVTRIAIFGVPGALAHHVPEMEAAARELGVHLHVLAVRGADEFESALNTATREGAGALLILPAPLFALHERRLAALAGERRLPALFWRRFFAEAGGLMAYGPSLADNWRRAAVLVGKILKGAKPADLPVERPTKFELVINLKTARALGFTMPPLLLFQADEVIQ